VEDIVETWPARAVILSKTVAHEGDALSISATRGVPVAAAGSSNLTRSDPSEFME
jgi:hypothetical protein